MIETSAAGCRAACAGPSSCVLDREQAHLTALLGLAELGGARVVEVGCGAGRLTVGIAREAASVLAFDPDEAAVARARETLPRELAERVTYRVASATELPVAPSAYDIVVFSWSLCCMEPGIHIEVLRRFRDALAPDGIVLDLQVIRPHPRVEVRGRPVCAIDGDPLFVRADAARAAVDQLVAAGLFAEEAVKDHDVLLRYESGSALVEDWARRERTIPPARAPGLRMLTGECVVRERCRLRRLRRVEGPG